MARGKNNKSRRGPVSPRTPVDNVLKADRMRRQFNPYDNELTLRGYMSRGEFKGLGLTAKEWTMLEQMYTRLAVANGGKIKEFNGKEWDNGGSQELFFAMMEELSTLHPTRYPKERIPRVCTKAPFEGIIMSPYEENLAREEFYRKVTQGIQDPTLPMTPRDAYQLLHEANGYEFDLTDNPALANADEGNKILQAAYQTENDLSPELKSLAANLDPAERAEHAMKTMNAFKLSLKNTGRYKNDQIELVAASYASIFASQTDQQILNGFSRDGVQHLMEMDKIMEDFMRVRNQLTEMGASPEMIAETEQKLMTAIWGDAETEKIVKAIDPNMIKTMQDVNKMAQYSEVLRQQLIAQGHDEDELDDTLALWAQNTFGNSNIPQKQRPLEEIYEAVKNVPMTEKGRAEINALLKENGYGDTQQGLIRAWQRLGQIHNEKKPKNTTDMLNKLRKLFGEEDK